MSSAALEEAWRKYRGWSLTARAIRAKLDRGHRIALILTVVGAALATLAARWGIWMSGNSAAAVARGLSGISAVAMAGAAYLGRSVLDPTAEQEWVRARALAETTKSEAYRYATRLPPYDSEDAGARLLDQLQKLLAANVDVVARELIGVEALGDMPAYPLSTNDYIKVRIQEQIGWFRRRAMEHERDAKRCSLAVQVLSGVAAVLGAVGALFTNFGVEAWVATLGTITAAIGSFALGQRYQRLAATYRVTADRLSLRLASWTELPKSKRSVEADQALVMDAEGILMAENQAWTADRQRTSVTAASTP